MQCMFDVPKFFNLKIDLRDLCTIEKCPYKLLI